MVVREAVDMSEERTRAFAEASIPEAYDRFMAPQLFEPWARALLARAGLRPGAAVLDVASGPGPVARGAAEAVGARGRVVANDISPAMLAVAAAKPVGSRWAPIEYLECSAAALSADAGSFDAVLCQQGLQFFPDRPLVLREMQRVARSGGLVLVASWAAERPLGLFGPMIEALREAGVDEPFPRAFDAQSYCIDAPGLHRLLAEAGLGDVVIETVELDAVWKDTAEAVATLLGTPYGPVVTALPPDRQNAVRDLFTRHLAADGGPVTIRTTSHIGRGSKER
jgi:ubiquinone/menaquinone biosynthesis C-methylase UbiE